MADKNEMRQDVIKDSVRILYEDDRYIIGVSSVGPNEHNLLVNDKYALLQRGIFNELARADSKRLRSSLSMVGQQVLEEMLTQNIPLEELGWALAKAAIKEQEEYASYLVAQEERA